MNRSAKDQSVFGEDFSPKSGDGTASLTDEPALKGLGAPPDSDESRLDSVWDEPHLQGNANCPTDAPTLVSWYAERFAGTSRLRSWLVVAGLAVAGGPFAVFGAISSVNSSTAAGLLAVIAFGPMLEELLKAGATMMTIERHPYLFRHAWQIPLTVAGSALGFAAVENLLYLNVYIDHPSESIVAWRWTVCTALHIGCSLIAGMGLMRMWHETRTKAVRPRTEIAFPYLITAIAVHGAYNLLATFTEVILEPF